MTQNETPKTHAVLESMAQIFLKKPYSLETVNELEDILKAYGEAVRKATLKVASEEFAPYDEISSILSLESSDRLKIE